MNARPKIDRRHNGGPPLNDPSTPAVYVGENFLSLFDPNKRYENYAFFGGRGTAKSTNAAIAVVLWAAAGYERIVCVRQYQNSIQNSVKTDIEWAIHFLGLDDDFDKLKTEIIHKKTKSRFSFVGLELHPESVKSFSGVTILWVEEAQTISARSLELLEPTIRSGRARCIWTWNPRFRTDPVDAMFRGNEKIRRDVPFVPPYNSYIAHVTINDNPFFYYHTRLPRMMQRMKANHSPRFEHVWDGGYDEAFETKIFTRVEQGRIEVPLHIAPRYGLDFSNGGAAPHAFVKVYVIPEKQTIYIAREYYGRVSLHKDLPTGLKTVLDDEADYIKADSAQPGSIAFLNSIGFNVDGARKGPGSVKAGINWLQGFNILVDFDCPETWEEFRLYAWQTDRITKKVLSTPVDDFNHCIDAIRYATEDAMENGSPDSSDDDGILRIKGF